MQERPTYEELEKRYYDFFNKCKPKYEQVHDKLQSAFLSFFSHEVRTHMNSIVGFADLLENSDISQSDRDVYIDNIINSGKVLLNTIDDNVNLAKIEIGEMKINNTHFDINNFIDELKSEFIDEKGEKTKDVIKFIANKESNKELFILSDKNKLKTIFTHLLNNAFEFTSYGAVEFGYRINDEVKLECFVKDSGTGILNEKLHYIKRIMENKYPNTVNGFEMKGQGLKIIKGFVKLLNGEITIKSIPGQGTDVYFTLPLIFATN